MKFYISSAFLNTREIVEIAKAADELGYDGIGIPDHVVNLETLETPYPYTKDGQRRWQPFTDWPDPWVLVGALAQVTNRLRFVTTVYIPAMRNPYSAAKAIGTAAVLASGRVEMQPTPPPIPVYVGGLSEAALRRAARNDGWIGDLIKTDRAIEAVGRMRELRLENGLSLDDFTILTPLTDAFTLADYRHAADAGITGIITMPWMFYAGPDATLADKIDGMQRFRKDLALDG
jgi:alkanesulfonate monooxygenase SsuD/methylene tetrahydromethanopterin reductase-like flavin-dependent oxidoreductase (luciferase family)